MTILSQSRDDRGRRRPELLAPAGDREAMRAAVANGADAVYFGLTRYNARQRAANFALEELSTVIGYLHEHNVRGYVTFNTLVFSDELSEASDYAAAIASAGADAVIVQDLGLVRLIKRLAPSLPVHASTQMTLTEPRAIEFMRALGVQRVILARELSLAEIRRIAAATPMPLEVFVHGALCMSYSGQCLASESLWGRSANRGLCGQACRLPYRLVVDGRACDIAGRAYLLSAKDLAAYDRVAELVRLGIAGFKIEGRLKSAQYVAVTTQVYRAAIDAALGGRPLDLPPRSSLDLAQSYSRGFTRGFLDGPNHRDLVHGLFPKSRGVRIGAVAGTNSKGVLVALEPQRRTRGAAIKPGDGVVFDNGRPDEDEQGGRVFSVEPRASKNRQAAIFLTFGAGHVNLAAVAVGSAVWKTDDPRLRREVAKTYARSAAVRRVPLTVRVEARVGRPLRVWFDDGEGNVAHVTSDQPLERAKNRPLTADLVREQFGRLGDTPFELREVQILGEVGIAAHAVPVMSPKSVLNDLRRRAVRQLMERRAAKARHAIAEPAALPAIRRSIDARCGKGESRQQSAPDLYVLVRRLDQLDAALDWTPSQGLARPATVYCDMPAARQHRDAVARCRAAGMAVGLATLRIAKPGEEDLLACIADAAPDAVLVRHLAGLSFFREHAPGLPLVGDFSLNVSNEVAASLLVEHGLARVTASLDLSLAQLRGMLGRLPASLCEAIVHLHMPMMHMEHCLLAARLADARDDRSCGRLCERRRVELRDRVGAEHPLVWDGRCRSTLFSGHVQSALPWLGEMRGLGMRHFRLEFLHEDATMVPQVLDLYARVLAGQLGGAPAWRRLAELHPTGVLRGTWEFN
jgi:putative protease